MAFFTHARCIACGAEVEALPDITLCPRCGGLLDICYDHQAIAARLNRQTLAARSEPTLWRWAELLPVQEQTAQRMAARGLKTGASPLYDAPELAQELGLSRLYIKDDGLNPTASLKDRASAMAVAKAQEGGYSAIACSSTGNAASSLAGHAARAGMKSYIFVPERAPQGKIAQLLIFGATVYAVQGDYAQTFRLSAAAIERNGWYNRNAAVNPYLVEGKKTVSLELMEQLQWQVPDFVAVSIGDGCTVAGVWKGLRELHTLGFIDKLPRLLTAQAEGCCPIHRAYTEQRPLQAMEENTLADSIAVGQPRNADKALAALGESQAVAVNVSDEQILAAMVRLGRSCGVYAEPAAAATMAALFKASREELLPPGASVACIITGNGLKDTANGIKAAGRPISVEADIE